MSWQPNKLEQERLDKAQQLTERGIELYPRRAHRTHTTAQAIAAYQAQEPANGDAAPELAVTVCGRIRRLNIKGKATMRKSFEFRTFRTLELGALSPSR